MTRTLTIAALLIAAAHPAAAQTFFPAGLAEQDARTIARFQALMPMCKSLKPGPTAKELWPRLWSGFKHVPPNEPAVRAWIAEETARIRDRYAGIPRTSAMWCDTARREFGPNRMAVNLDGSKAERDCKRDDTCASPSYLYGF